jgi:hypothetical protein
MSVSELRERAGRSKQALSTYLKRHGVETAQFLHPKRDQLVQYIRTEDAQKYLRCQGGLEVSETARMDGLENAVIEATENTQNDLATDAEFAPNFGTDLDTEIEARATNLSPTFSPALDCSKTETRPVDEKFVSEPFQPVSQPSEVLMGLEYATNTQRGGLAAQGEISPSRLAGYNERETSMFMSCPSFVLRHCDSEYPSDSEQPRSSGSNCTDVLSVSQAPSVLAQSLS